MITIAIDVMGGDFGPAVTVPASVRALSFMPDISVILLGDNEDIQFHLSRLKYACHERIRVVATTQTVGMDEKPVQALRNKKDSSLFRAIQLLQEGEVQACVSAGNTGALLAVGCHLLGTFDGIDRPAICAAIPTDSGQAFLLDVGANVDVPAINLHQFAVMGSVLASAVLKIQKPRIGLLNIGVEDIKGNERVRHAALLLHADKALNYTGFVEADQLFFNRVDVAVCDGFVGNVALKASEGAARLIGYKLRDSLSASFFRRIASIIIRPALAGFRSKISPSRYNGASFLGLTATVVKSHGGADIESFSRAIAVARAEVLAEIPRQIQHKLQEML
ncbi:MAG: phosphate acyltransferase PlsX [Cellvibrionales bacterium]|nr:phosphate acyltransferase PlsX [Cellvibrionales bacterium]